MNRGKSILAGLATGVNLRFIICSTSRNLTFDCPHVAGGVVGACAREDVAKAAEMAKRKATAPLGVCALVAPCLWDVCV
ncbi:MAG: hypothetical protein WAU89_04445 [Candidatus Acidiferrales bacterium]